MPLGPITGGGSGIDPNNVDFTGGTMNGVVIGGSDPRAATFTTVSLTGSGSVFNVPNGTWFSVSDSPFMRPVNGHISIGSDFDFGFCSSGVSGYDVFLGRSAIGVLQVNNGMGGGGVIELLNVPSISTVTGGARIGVILGVMSVLNDGGTTRAIALNSEVIRAAVFTVATLPAGNQGDMAAVTDALAPVYRTTVLAGGSAFTFVQFDGSNWIS